MKTKKNFLKYSFRIKTANFAVNISKNLIKLMKKTIVLLLMIFFFTVFSSQAADEEKGWIISTNDFNADYTGVPVANGTIGLLPWKEPFSIRHLILNHIFEYNDNSGVNCMIKGINPFNLVMNVDGKTIGNNNISNWKQSLDMRHASHNTSFIAEGKVKVSYSFIALRNLPYTTIIRIQLQALDNADISFSNIMEIPDKEYQKQVSQYCIIHGDANVEILKTNAETAHGRYKESVSATFIPEKGNFNLSGSNDNRTSYAKIHMTAGQSATLTLGATVCTTHDFSDPYSESDRELIYLKLQGIDEVIAGHNHLWDELWQGDIKIDGDLEAQQVVRCALYNLYSYCRQGTSLSISPMGLSSQGYNGHIFWDSEIWMYPPMLFMNQGIAQSMIDYRCKHLDAAKTRASVCGYQGAMFPWESDEFGQESTPTFATTGQFEHHITGDIAFGAWNYYRVTRNKKWLRNEGWPLIKAAAEFWVSRVKANPDGTYSINNVIGADEYAQGVNDNAFTNGAAITTLQCAIKAAKIVGEKASKKWATISNKIRISKMADGVTAEYDGYNGQTIKQGDANLLSYPFDIITDKAQIFKDLNYYIQKIDMKNGPAMAFGILSVIYNHLGQAEKADEMFRRSYRPNIHPPFNAFAETPSSHNPYFATGAGAMLQAVINGFGGLSITDKGIVQKPSVLPNSWKKLTITGVGKDKKTYTVVNHK